MRAGSMSCRFATAAIICRIDSASPPSRRLSSAENQLKHRFGLFCRCCSGNSSRNHSDRQVATSPSRRHSRRPFGCIHEGRPRGREISQARQEHRSTRGACRGWSRMRSIPSTCWSRRDGSFPPTGRRTEIDGQSYRIDGSSQHPCPTSSRERANRTLCCAAQKMGRRSAFARDANKHVAGPDGKGCC